MTLDKLHEIANPLAVALSPDETVLASGGADSSVVLCQWGAADNGTEEAAAAVVDQACRLACSAPVIDLAFSCTLRGVLAMGCMDGSVCIAHYETTSGCLQATSMATEARHQKYVRAVAWAPTRPLLATSSADGSVLVFKVEKKLALLNDEEEESTEPPLTIQLLQSLHFSGSVETICFSNDKLICYARGTPYLSYFDLDEDFNQTKINLNKASDSATGGFEDHVSFAVMDMVCRDNKYLACATDTSRNIILELSTGKQIRNLYGHQNDLYSQPKIAWSANGQYIYGNTQEESCVCVWDIASSQIVERLQGGHAHPIRALYSSPTSDTLVTTSFDKKTKLWFAPIATKEEL